MPTTATSIPAALLCLLALASSASAQPALNHLDGVRLGDSTHYLRKTPYVTYLQANPIQNTRDWKLPHGYASTRSGHVVALTITSPRVSVYGLTLGASIPEVTRRLGSAFSIEHQNHPPGKPIILGYSQRNLEFYFKHEQVDRIRITRVD